MKQPDLSTAAGAVAWLRTPAAIRQRCGRVYAAAEADGLSHFALCPQRLDPTVDYVLDTIRRIYPDLNVPFHSRWRHFSAGGRDRWAELAHALPDAEHGRARVELVVVSVLLDAGAGDVWRYRDRDREVYARSEGLALASLALYRSGALSTRPQEQPLRVDATALQQLGTAQLNASFQVTADNPLIGVEGRVALLRRLGEAVAARPQLFGVETRLGKLFDHLVDRADNGRLPAATILTTLLDTFSGIWPGRIEIGGANLGDVWRHPAAGGDGLTAGLVPFHKLSQWLSYSLLEPLLDAGITVTDLDQLTGLPEYRNGGLLIDLGLLRPRDPRLLAVSHPADSEVVVEWRALTVILLDKLAERLRQRLNLTAAELPLAKVLEGGTWAAGRRAAAERRPQGGPPLTLASDGTVF